MSAVAQTLGAHALPPITLGALRIGQDVQLRCDGCAAPCCTTLVFPHGHHTSRRNLDYLRYLGSSLETAKEVKLFGLGDFLGGLVSIFDLLSHHLVHDGDQRCGNVRSLCGNRRRWFRLVGNESLCE